VLWLVLGRIWKSLCEDSQDVGARPAALRQGVQKRTFTNIHSVRLAVAGGWLWLVAAEQSDCLNPIQVTEETFLLL